MLKFSGILLVLGLAMVGYSQDLALSLSPQFFNKALKEIIKQQVLERKFNIEHEKIQFTARNIKLQKPEKTAPNNFLKVYGRHLLFMEFDKPFEAEVELKGLSSELGIENVDVKLFASRSQRGITIVPFEVSVSFKETDVMVNGSHVYERGLTSSNNGLMERIEKDLENLIAEKKKSGGDQLNKQIFERYSLLQCMKEQKAEKKRVEFTANNHSVNLKGIGLQIAGEAVLEAVGNNVIVRLQNNRITDNISPENFDEKININLTGEQFHIDDVITITYGLNSQEQLEVNCHQLKGSISGLQRQLFDGTIIPKIKEVLRNKIDELLEVKLYPKVEKKLAEKSFSFKRALEKKLEFSKIFKKKNTEQKKIDIGEIFRSQFETVMGEVRARSLKVDSGHRINLTSDLNISVDNDRIECSDTHYLSCKFFKDAVSLKDTRRAQEDINLAVNGKLIAEVINRFDHVLMDEVVKTIPFLIDDEEQPLLTMDNHDVLIVPVEKNVLDVTVKFNVKTSRMKRVLQFLLKNDYTIKRSWNLTKKTLCTWLVVSKPELLHFLPVCMGIEVPQKEWPVLSFALDIRLSIEKDSLRARFPEAQSLFSSKYLETSWEDHYTLRMIKALLNEKEWRIDMGPPFFQSLTIYKYPGLYKTLLKKVLGESKDTLKKDNESYYVDFPLLLPDTQAYTVKRFEINKSGHILLGVDLKKVKELAGKLKLGGRK